MFIPNIEIKGTGLNTNSLVEYTKKVVNQSSKIYGQVWVVFDKDDYQDAQFCDCQKNASRNPTTMVYKIVEGLEEYL